MIRYGDERRTELKFAGFVPHIERRDEQWVDVELRWTTEEGTPMPEDVIDMTGLIVCTHEGHPLQMIPLDEGCDCEYQFTAWEKEQLEAYIRSEPIQFAIRQAAQQNG